MDITLTTIIAILGISGAVFLIPAVRNKLSSILSFKQGKHEAEQTHLEEKIETSKKEVLNLQTKVKELDKKAKVTNEIVKEVVKSGNKRVEEVLKEPKMKKLIKEFDKW